MIRQVKLLDFLHAFINLCPYTVSSSSTPVNNTWINTSKFLCFFCLVTLSNPESVKHDKMTETPISIGTNSFLSVFFFFFPKANRLALYIGCLHTGFNCICHGLNYGIFYRGEIPFKFLRPSSWK